MPATKSQDCDFGRRKPPVGRRVKDGPEVNPAIAGREVASRKNAQPIGWAFFYLLFLTGCAHTPSLQTHFFALYSEAPSTLSSIETLPIVIEGDGYAWITRSRASKDPTPRANIARQMAYHIQNAVYLARPCQYVWSKPCEPLYWTSGRFHLQVVESLEEGIEQLKSRYHAKKLRLIGYSGGGVLAGIIAARRQDVIEWVSVASPLDEEAWVRYHHVSPLDASLSLKYYQKQLEKMPQTHYVGADDRIVPWVVNAGWVSAMQNNPQAVFYLIPQYQHGSDWSAVVR